MIINKGVGAVIKPGLYFFQFQPMLRAKLHINHKILDNLYLTPKHIHATVEAGFAIMRRGEDNCYWFIDW